MVTHEIPIPYVEKLQKLLDEWLDSHLIAKELLTWKLHFDWLNPSVILQASNNPKDSSVWYEAKILLPLRLRGSRFAKIDIDRCCALLATTIITSNTKKKKKDRNASKAQERNLICPKS